MHQELKYYSGLPYGILDTNSGAEWSRQATMIEGTTIKTTNEEDAMVEAEKIIEDTNYPHMENHNSLYAIVRTI